MIYPARLTSRVLMMGSSLFCATSMMAQDQAAEATTAEDDIVYLSPFEVTSEGSIGYAAKDTLAGTRLRTDLKDVANAIQVVNSQFLQDTGATDSKSLLVYTTNTEVGGVGGNFANIGSGTADSISQNARMAPQNNTRVRGLDSADNTRDFFLTGLPWDGYNVTRVEIQRGANSTLFGMGSPAGIINTVLSTAEMFNEGKVEVRAGSYGSIRGVVDVNRVILDGELAVRIEGLYEDEKFRQEPAFEKDKRVYGALRYEPKWAKIGSSRLTIKMNFEDGEIEANRPRTTPPFDQISAWYTQLDQKVYDGTVVNLNNMESAMTTYASNTSYGLLQKQLKASAKWTYTNPTTGATTTYKKSSLIDNPNYYNDTNGDGYVDGSFIKYFATYWETAAVYEDASSSTMSGIKTAQVVNYNNQSVIVAPSISGLTGFGIMPYSEWASSVGLAGADIGAWKDIGLTDTGIFDFKNKLLYGDNKRELEDWQSANMTISETFMDNAFGFEMSYNYENDTQTYKSRSSSDVILVDMSTTLVDGSENPNVGRAYTVSKGYGYESTNMRQTSRITSFVDLDLKKYFDPDSFWVKLLGRHLVQGNYSRFTVKTENRGWMPVVMGTGFGYGVGNSSPSSRALSTQIYISDDLRNTSSASEANCSRIYGTINPVSGTMTQWIGTKDTTKYTEAAVEVWNDSNPDDMMHLYSAKDCTKQKEVTDSWGLVLNSYMFNFEEDDGFWKYMPQVVPTVGYREDRRTTGRSGGAASDSQNGEVDFGYDGWYVSDSSEDAALDGLKTGRFYEDTGWVNSTSWSVMVHMPESLVNKMPWGLNLSAFYNKSDNFRPDSSRIDLFGDTIESPRGDTKEYGIVIGALDDRLTLKINWYDSTVTNATMTSGAVLNYFYMLGQYEWTGFLNILEAKYGVGAYAQSKRTWVTEDDPTNSPWAPGTDDTGDVYSTNEEALARFNETYAAMMDKNNWPSESFQKANFGGMTFQDLIDLYESDPSSHIDLRDSKMTYQYASCTVDTRSRGVEYEFTTQITPNWNLTFNAAKTEAVNMNMAQSYIDLTENRYTVYTTTAYGYAKMWGPESGNTSETIVGGRWMTNYYGAYLLTRLKEGSNVDELCEWRFNLVTNYSFDKGFLKGANVGLAYRWQDKVTIGYPVIYNEDGTVYIDPVTNTSMYDIDSPIKGPSEDAIDIWVGYEHAINDNVKWRIQLNVKDLFADDELIPISSQPDGTIANYRIPAETTFYITNTFTF